MSNYQGEITITELTKHYPPDTKAAFIWLKNRRSEDWKDKVEIDPAIDFKETSLDFLMENYIKVMDRARARDKAMRIERGMEIDAEYEKVKE